MSHSQLTSLLNKVLSLGNGDCDFPHYSDNADGQPLLQPLPPEKVELLISRLREHIQCNRIRISDHFQDSDPYVLAL